MKYIGLNKIPSYLTVSRIKKRRSYTAFLCFIRKYIVYGQAMIICIIIGSFRYKYVIMTVNQILI